MLNLFKHFNFIERIKLNDLLKSDYLIKPNGKPNISKIAKILNKSRNTIMREIKRLNNIQNYNPNLAHKDYLEKRKKSIKKVSMLLTVFEWLDEKYNKFHNSPE